MNIKLTIEKYKAIEKIFNGLRLVANISDNNLITLFNPDCDKSDVSIYSKLCSSLQNSGQMSGSIKFYKENNENIREVVFNFNAKEVLENYKTPDKLYDAFKKKGIVDNGSGENKETNWQKYAKGLMDGAKFLTSEKEGEKGYGYKEVRRLCSLAATNVVTKEMVQDVIKISKKIHGVGLALTCDWLKECGCTWLVKPDTHIIKVYNHLVGLPADNKTKDQDVIINMFDWSKKIKEEYDPSCTAYKLDRMIWLICTGNFFQFDISIGRDLIIKLIK